MAYDDKIVPDTDVWQCFECSGHGGWAVIEGDEEYDPEECEECDGNGLLDGADCNDCDAPLERLKTETWRAVPRADIHSLPYLLCPPCAEAELAERAKGRP